MFDQNAPEECVQAGLDGSNRNDHKKCEEIMRDFEGGRDFGNQGHGGFGGNCAGIEDPKERLECYDSATQGVGDYEDRFKETKERERECARSCSEAGGAWDFSGGECNCYFDDYEDYKHTYSGDYEGDYPENFPDNFDGNYPDDYPGGEGHYGEDYFNKYDGDYSGDYEDNYNDGDYGGHDGDYDYEDYSDYGDSGEDYSDDGHDDEDSGDDGSHGGGDDSSGDEGNSDSGGDGDSDGDGGGITGGVIFDYEGNGFLSYFFDY